LNNGRTATFIDGLSTPKNIFKGEKKDEKAESHANAESGLSKLQLNEL
jgi:hypothetical protein